MPLLDTGTLLASLSDTAPCGDDLEYDPAFMQLERSARGPSQDRLVGPEEAAEGPDWRAIRDQALGLLTRTRDLRVLTILAKTLLRTDGLPGFAAGLELLQASLSRYWDSIHPILSAEEDYNPIMRVNVLRELCDHREVLSPLRVAPLVTLPGLGSVSWKDVALATGELTPAEGESVPDTGKIDAAFANCDGEQLAATVQAAAAALAAVRGVEEFLTEKIGVGQAISFDPLSDVLRRVDAVLRNRVALRSGGEAGEAQSEDASASGPSGVGQRERLGAIASRADVVRALDLICAYYERSEPSSPVPLLLRRAKRLSGMDFMEIVRNMAPSGATEVETIRGPQEETE
jgi:type VI secretion system protein ImpA